MTLFSNKSLLNAQTILGGRGLGMGQAVTALNSDEWAIFGNVAMMQNNNSGLAVYGIRNYGIPELSEYSAVFSITNPVGYSAVGLHHFGDELFSELRIRVAQKNQYHNIHLGLAVTYTQVSFGGSYRDNGSRALGLDLGVGAEISDGLWIGARSVNINKPQFNFGEDLPRELVLGLAYNLNDDFLFSSDLVKDVRFPISYRGGFEYQIMHSVFIRSGVTTTPLSYSLGFGIVSGLLKIDFAFQQHDELGLSPGVGIAKSL